MTKEQKTGPVGRYSIKNSTHKKKKLGKAAINRKVSQDRTSRKAPCSVKHRKQCVPCNVGVVYKIPLSCGHVSVGETGRCLNTTLQEHNSDLKENPYMHLDRVDLSHVSKALEWFTITETSARATIMQVFFFFLHQALLQSLCEPSVISLFEDDTLKEAWLTLMIVSGTCAVESCRVYFLHLHLLKIQPLVNTCPVPFFPPLHFVSFALFLKLNNATPKSCC